MRKKPKTIVCSKCRKPGHNARSCGNAPAKTPAPPRTTRTRKTPRTAAEIARGALTRISKPAAVAPAELEIRRTARDQAKVLLSSKLHEEIVYAEEYLAELKRMAAAG